MLMSMNVFHQTTTPKLLNFPSVSCIGRRRRSSSSHFLVSSPATTMDFNSKLLSIHSCHGTQHSFGEPVLGSPATMGFHPKSLHFLTCHGFSESSCKPVSHKTMKFGSVLFALPRDDEQFASDNEEEPVFQEHVEEHHSLISSDNLDEKQSNKLKFEVREVKLRRDINSSAWLKAQVYHEDRLHESSVGKDMGKYTQQESDMIQRRYKDQTKQPFMCIIAVRKYGENERNEMLEDVIGTLNFSGETYPEEVVTKTKIKTSKSKQRKLQKYGIISKIAVAKSARRQGVGSSMLKFAIEAAKDKGIEQVFLYVNGDNKPALALCEKMGVPILDNKEEPKIQEHEELRLRTLISSDKQLKKVSGGELKRQEISISVATHDIVFWSSAFLRSGLSEDESHPRKFIHYCHGTKHSSSESVLGSPATMGFHPKSLHFLTCHGFSESSCKPVSHKTMKFCPVLFAQPRESGNFPSGDEDIQEHNKHSTSISSDDVKEEQSKKLSSGEVKKLEFEVREAATPDECWASTCLRAEEFYKEQSNSRYVDGYKEGTTEEVTVIGEVKKLEFEVREADNDEEIWASARLKAEENFIYDSNSNVDALKQKNAEQEYEKIYRGYARRSDEPFMCFVAVRNVDENVNGKNVIGTLNFRVKYNFDLEGKNYPEALVKPEMPSPFRNGGTPYGVFTRVAVDKSARRQGVAGRMLKFVIGIAKQKGIPEVYLHVRRDNTAALRLYEKLGFTKIEEATPVPYLETHYVYLCRMIL